MNQDADEDFEDDEGVVIESRIEQDEGQEGVRSILKSHLFIPRFILEQPSIHLLLPTTFPILISFLFFSSGLFYFSFLPPS